MCAVSVLPPHQKLGNKLNQLLFFISDPYVQHVAGSQGSLSVNSISTDECKKVLQRVHRGIFGFLLRGAFPP